MSKNLYILFDMDAFFSSVEEVDRGLRNDDNLCTTPVIVGGIYGRGVVSTCNYEARKYGVKSGMPTAIAQNLAPNALFLPVNFSRYIEVSDKVFNIAKEYSFKMERVSIDEAFLEIEGDYESGYILSKLIQSRIFEETKLTCSLGLSFNMFLAKMGSELNKPNGITIIKEEDVIEILKPLPIKKIYGIGDKTATKFNNMALYTVEDLLDLDLNFFINYFGSKLGLNIYEKIRGIDNRKISENWERKSYGKEMTLAYDINNDEDIKSVLKDFAKDITAYLEKNNLYCKTITVKYKTKEFNSHTKSKSISRYSNDYTIILSNALDIAGCIDFTKGIRLIGLSVSNLEESSFHQLEF